jgi:hypothetical protein
MVNNHIVNKLHVENDRLELNKKCLQVWKFILASKECWAWHFSFIRM